MPATTKKRPARKGASKKKPTCNREDDAQDIWRRTRQLVEVLLQVMEQEIRAADGPRSEQWVRLFGSKDSAVVNLQKLVQLLAELQGNVPQSTASTQALPEDADMELLRQWLQDINAAHASPEA